MTVQQVPLCELVEDFDLYPRTDVSSRNVNNLISALQVGRILPPIIADRESKRIVDGFHRRRAYLRVLGKDSAIDVDLRAYQSDTEMFADAVTANTSHGLPLQEVEKRRIVLRLESAMTADQIAEVLHVPAEKVQQLRFRTAIVDEGGGSVRLEPLKKPLFHLSGQKMTEAQARAQRSAPGTSYLLLIQQLQDAIRWNLFDISNPAVMSALSDLSPALVEFLDGLEAS